SRPPVRIVTWQAFKTDIRFQFLGALIILANDAPQNCPAIEAVKTRISTLKLDASDKEIAALMKSISLQGFAFGNDYLTPLECVECCNHIIRLFEQNGKPLDMRLLTNGFKDFIQVKTGFSKTTWEELIKARMMESTNAVRKVSRAERVAQERG